MRIVHSLEPVRPTADYVGIWLRRDQQDDIVYARRPIKQRHYRCARCNGVFKREGLPTEWRCPACYGGSLPNGKA